VSLSDALKTLSDAHGPSALARAFGALQGQVRQARKASKAQYGNLAQTFVAAMRIWDAQKADGVPKAERLAGLEKSLRAAWPQTREWKYVCHSCEDTGGIFAECPGNDHCGRKNPHLAHSYIAPCFCPKGVRFREKPQAAPEDFKAAGRSKPMTRVGR
jgi:hypothetical protein